VLLLVATAAYAYVPPADFVLRMVAERRFKLNIVDLTVQLATDKPGHKGVIEERIYIKSPERMRRVRQADGVTTLWVQVEDKAAEGPEGGLKLVKGNLDLLPILLQPAGSELDDVQVRLVGALKRLGIDTTKVTLGRSGQNVAYVVGGRSTDTDKTQLWVDKETYLPIKVVLPKKVGAGVERTEIRWLEFGSAVTGDWFPRVIEVWKDGKRIERSEVSKVDVNKKVPDTLFTLP